MPTPEHIAELYRERKKAKGAMLARARLVADAYNGDLLVPLPEIDKEEAPGVANLIQQGIDQTGMRIASAMPDVHYPPLRPNIGTSEEKARTRRDATLGWWTSNSMNLKLRRRARWLITYTCAPVLIRPDAKHRMPVWRNRNPLATYPNLSGDPDEMEPDDCIFAFTRTFAWLSREYPDQAARLRIRNKQNDTLIEVLEYVDADEFHLIAVGQHADEYDPVELRALSPAETLVRSVNRAGVCTAVVPGRITLDRPIGQFDGMVGLYREGAELAALNKHAVKKGVFPEMWAVARQNETVSIVTVADPIKGVIGEIQGGDLKEIQLDPGFASTVLQDRLTEAQRMSGGIPSEFQGVAATNVRTGRRAEQLISSVVDFPIQEAQEVLARSLELENQRAIAIDKAWWGSTKKSFHVSWRTASKRSDYTPNDVFEDDINVVAFPLSGGDANTFVIRGGQKMGLGTMSRRSFMERDPETADAEEEDDRIVFERLREGVLVEFEQPQSLPLPLKAKVAKRILQNRAEVFDAIEDAQRELQEQQAEASGGEPGMQPGLNDPLAAPQPPPQAPGLADLVGQLNL